MNLWHDLEPGPSVPDVIHVIVEIPKGSRNKYEYHKQTGAFKLDRVLYSPVHYPGDYGFVPQTYYEDGDPLDVLVVTNLPTFTGCIVEARPVVLNHNTETAPRLYRTVRPQGKYMRSMELLQRAKRMDGEALTKSGIMVGLGETWEEILQVMDDLRAHDVDIMTIGQYLQPSRFHLPIQRYYTPDEFARLKEEGEQRGFKWMESGPLVRSSYHADGQAHLSPRKL